MGYTITIDTDKCTGDAECVDVCPVEVYELEDGKAVPVDEPSNQNRLIAQLQCENAKLRAVCNELARCGKAIVDSPNDSYEFPLFPEHKVWQDMMKAIQDYEDEGDK